MDLQHISKREQASILQVIQRDNVLRKNEAQRLAYVVCLPTQKTNFYALFKILGLCYNISGNLALANNNTFDLMI